jgi:hypothetical protein
LLLRTPLPGFSLLDRIEDLFPVSQMKYLQQSMEESTAATLSVIDFLHKQANVHMHLNFA